MIHIALQEKRVATKKNEIYPHFLKPAFFISNYNEAHPNLSQKRQKSYH